MNKKTKFISFLKVTLADLSPDNFGDLFNSDAFNKWEENHVKNKPVPKLEKLPKATPKPAKVQVNKPAQPSQSPSNYGFGEGPIENVRPVGKGINDAQRYTIGGKDYFVKNDDRSVYHEALAHDLGSRFGIRVPKTITKHLPHKGYNGALHPHSMQEGVEGVTGTDLLSKKRGYKVDDNYDIPDELKSHPDMIKMMLGDKLIRNYDRHSGNWMYNKGKNEVYAIDHGHAFAPIPHNMLGYRDAFNMTDPYIDDNISKLDQDAPIPEDFRQGILNADPEEHENIIRNHLDTGENNIRKNAKQFIKHEAKSDMKVEEYLERLKRFKQHMGNPNIQTVGQFHNAMSKGYIY